MIENVIARRYARGLADLAVERDEVEAVRQDADNLADLLDPERGDFSVPELLAFLRSPTVPEAQKVHVTDQICEALKIGKTVSDFLNVLIAKNRVGLIANIVREYDRLAAAIQETRNAIVETAYPLSGKQEKALREALEKATGASVRLDVRENRALLAGLRVRLEDMLLDESIDNHLRRLASRLT
jgi:F-type H+-transporting ATPase subunit delta